jgi:hypothetical protein
MKPVLHQFMGECRRQGVQLGLGPGALLLLLLVASGALASSEATLQAGPQASAASASPTSSHATVPAAPLFNPLCFLHVPKTAGTTVSALLQQALQELGCVRDELVESAPPPPAGAPCTYAHPAAGLGTDARVALGQAAAGASNRLVRLDFLMGHLPFGTCPLLNATRPCAYTTVLRPPLERLLSHYSYIMRVAPHIMLEPCPGCASIDGFARALAAGRLRRLLLDDLTTRMLAGDGFWSTFTDNRIKDVAPMADAAMLKVAKFNLAHHFPIVGFTDDLGGYMRRLRVWLGLPPDAPPEALVRGQGPGREERQQGAAAAPAAALRLRETPARTRLRVAHLAPETRKLLLRAVAQDAKLYEFARRLVRRRGDA